MDDGAEHPIVPYSCRRCQIQGGANVIYYNTIAASAAILFTVAMGPAGAQMTSTQPASPWHTRLGTLSGYTLFLASNCPVDAELFDPSGGHSHEQYKRRKSATIFPT